MLSDLTAPEKHSNYTAVMLGFKFWGEPSVELRVSLPRNEALAAHFALASLFGCVARGLDMTRPDLICLVDRLIG